MHTLESVLVGALLAGAAGYGQAGDDATTFPLKAGQWCATSPGMSSDASKKSERRKVDFLPPLVKINLRHVLAAGG